ncbi:acyltransferase domain-containing protein, partial [Streptomyces sp. NPDC003717]|uniref:acyltransferase domain-containing protein n=1 Tax=Streptomyces sp. NPDC003717 TaxID=3154276 RepID=UPI0033BF2964
GPRERLDHTTWAQAGLFALQVGLARLWESVGVRPDVVIGHSVGEIAAAYVAGVFDLADACRVVGARARLMGGLPAGGAMCAVQATAEELAAGLEGSTVSVAAVNTPDSTVVSGPVEEVERVAAVWRGRGRKTKALSVSHAFHSVLMAPMLEEFTEAISSVAFRVPSVTLMSNVSGAVADEEITAPGYWARHVRQAVLFQPAVAAVAARAGVFIELGPAPVLTTAAQHTLDDTTDPDRPEPVVTASLDPSQPDDVAFGQAMARLHTAGVDVDWADWFPADPAPRTVPLPTYAFQGRRFWLADVLAPETVSSGSDEEAGFWTAVEGEDVQALCDTLHLKDDQRRSAMETVFPALSAWRRERRERSVVDAWRYRVDWRRVEPAAAPAADPDDDPGTWLIVTPGLRAGAWPQACARALEQAGAHVSVVEVGPGSGRAELTALLGSRPQDARPVAGVLSLLALNETPETPETPEALVSPETPETSGPPWSANGLTDTLTLLHALLDTGIEAPLWCATRGAVSCGSTDPVTSPAQAPVWGLGRVAAQEHPALWGGLVDLPADPEGLEAGSLYAVLRGNSGEDQVALRPAGVLGRRLLPEGPGTDGVAEEWQPHGAVLVTGGVGQLADQVVRWLAECGAEHVVLLEADGAGSREGSDLRAHVREHGARLTVLPPCRIGDREAVARALGELTGVRIRTVIHTSLPGELAPLTEVTPEELGAAVSAAVHLGEPAGAGTVETVLFFSSVAATLGSREHGAHAAANAYLDALAQTRAADGPRTLAVGWGIWDLPEDGELARERAGLSRRQGLPPLEPRLALGALRGTLDGDEGHVLVADVEWERFVPLFTLARPTRLLDDVPAARRVLEAASESDDGADVAELRRELTALPARERTGALVDLVRGQVAAVLRYEPGQEVEPDKAFKDLGFDSLVVVELRNRLRGATGLRLPATLVYNFPTPRALAEHLLARILPDGGAAELPVAAHVDDLDEALAGLALDDPRRLGLVRRLRALLWKHADAAGAVDRADESGQRDSDDLSEASADDMFALIDREWGSQ